MERKTWLDALKGIAICGVIMTHSGGADMSSFVGTIGRLGRNGVQMFFIISAMLAFTSLERLYNVNNVGKYSSLKWIAKKLLCLMPIYYLAIFLYVMHGGSSYWYGLEGRVTIYNILSHLTFTNGLFPHYANSIIGAEWYLGTLVIFYLFSPVLYRFINSFEKSLVFTFISIMAGNYIYFCLEKLVPQTEDAYIYYSYLGTFSFLAQLPVIAMGINLFYILKLQVSGLKQKKLLAYTILIFALIMIWGHGNNNNRLYMMSEDTVFGFWCVMIVISQMLETTKLIDNCLFRALGKYSLSIYLFHYLVIFFCQKHLKFDFGIRTVNWAVRYIIIVAFSFVIGFILEKMINIPFRKMISQKLR